MKIFCAAIAVIGLGGFLIFSVAEASFTHVSVSNDSALARQLAYSITLTSSPKNSSLVGTHTFQLRAPTNAKLKGLSRVILRIQNGKRLMARVPLEITRDKSGAVLCHFQLTPEIAKTSLLQLVVVPDPRVPSGVVYEVDLSSYLKTTE